jgi:hypothetical protein
MSALDHKRTLATTRLYVCCAPECGHLGLERPGVFMSTRPSQPVLVLLLHLLDTVDVLTQDFGREDTASVFRKDFQ